MQPHSEPLLEIPAPPETRVRFTLRGVFIFTAAAAGGMAVLAPQYRHWNGQQQAAFAAVFFNVAVGVAVSASFGVLQRLRAERCAGPPRYRLPLSMSRFLAVSTIGWALFLSALLISHAASSVELAKATLVDFTAIKFGAMLGLAGLAIWWKTACLELCDAGMLRGWQFVPWKLIRGASWGTSVPDLLVVKSGWSVVTARVRPADKPAIEQFLASRLPAKLN